MKQKISNSIAFGALIISATLFAGAALATANAPLASSSVHSKTTIRDAKTEEEILWLARLIFSETKLPEEQLIIAWIARNRVETNFRGATTYKEVALAPAQFSGLHPSDAQYSINISLTPEMENKSWQQALAIASEVYFSPSLLRPLPIEVKHFYSPHAVSNDPKWAADKEPILTLRSKDSGNIRFAFYADIR